MTTQLQQICAGFETFPPASAGACAAAHDRFSNFRLDQYLELLLQTNGLGDVVEAGGKRHIHNMLMLPIEEAITESERECRDEAFVIGRPGVDGILFVLQPGRPDVYAYYPIESEFSLIAESVVEFLKAWTANAIRL